MRPKLTQNEIALVGGLSDADLSILSRLNLPAIVEDRRNAMLKALFRSHRYARQAPSTRARNIERDIRAAQHGAAKPDESWQRALNRLAALCGEHTPCANTILRICKDVRVS